MMCKLLVTLLFLLPAVRAVDPCIPGINKQLSPDTKIPKSTKRGHIIVPAYNFTCHGIIESWEAKFTAEVRDETYKLVGENVIARQNNGDVSTSGHKLTLEIEQESKQIHVMPGDFIGLFFSERYAIETLPSPNIKSYIVEEFTTPVQTFDYPLDNVLDPQFNQVVNVAPQITVQIQGELIMVCVNNFTIN